MFSIYIVGTRKQDTIEISYGYKVLTWKEK